MKGHSSSSSSQNKMILYMILWSILIGYIFMTILISQNKTFNLNKVYQALLMGSLMGLVMVFLMRHELSYSTKKKWTIFLLFSTLLLVFLIRKQVFVGERQFAKSMLEHHEMAVVMSDLILSKPNTKDPFIRNLAQSIIQSQEKEIQQMKTWVQQNPQKIIN